MKFLTSIGCSWFNTHKLLKATAVIVLIFSITACLGSNPQPETVAVEWWQAFVKPDRDKLASLTCKTRIPDTELSMNVLAGWTQLLPQAIGGVLGIGNLEVDLSSYDIESSIVSQDKISAVVKLTGNLRSSVVGISATQKFQYPLQMLFEDGRWTVCDKIIFDIVQEITLGQPLAEEIKPLVEEIKPLIATPVPQGTLSIEQAVQATIQADQAIKATLTTQAILTLTPEPTSTPTPLSSEDQQKAIATALARATVEVEVAVNKRTIEGCYMPLSPDGKTLASVQWDTASLINIETGQLMSILNEPGFSRVGGIAVFSPDGRFVATQAATENGVGKETPFITIWNTADGSLYKKVEGEGEEFAFSTDGELLAETHRVIYANSLNIWRLTAEGSPVPLYQEVYPDDAGTQEMLFSPDNHFLAVLTNDRLTLYEITDSSFDVKLSQIFEGFLQIEFMAFNQSSETLITSEVGGDDRRTIKFWNTITGKLIDEVTEEGRLSSYYMPMVMSQDRSLIATKTGHGISVWNVSDRKLVNSWKTPRHAEYFTFYPGNEFLATTDASGGFIQIWQVNNGQLIATFNDLTGVDEITFTSDGQYLVASRGVCHVWFVGDLLK